MVFPLKNAQLFLNSTSMTGTLLQGDAALCGYVPMAFRVSKNYLVERYQYAQEGR